jgi:hypothetical protein
MIITGNPFENDCAQKVKLIVCAVIVDKQREVVVIEDSNEVE